MIHNVELNLEQISINLEKIEIVFIIKSLLTFKGERQKVFQPFKKRTIREIYTIRQMSIAQAMSIRKFRYILQEQKGKRSFC